MDNRDKILAMARNAPLLPTKVAKMLNTNSLLASAMLSELVSKGQLKVSHLKVGSSPLYYIPDCAGQLQAYAQYLNSKDKRAYDLLKEKKVLRENDLEPLTRVAVKNIKDFSRPLEVSFGETKEIFWKWYLLPDSEAAPIIKQLLNIDQTPEASLSAEKSTAPELSSISADTPDPEPKKKHAAEHPQELTQEKEVKPKKARPVRQKKLDEKPAEKEKVIKPAKKIDSTDPFFKKLMRFFEKNNITVIEHTAIRKKSEYDFIIELNSAMGSLTYFCKAKNKKRVSEGDLSSAYVQGQLKKLPVILLAPGDLTKQAKVIAKELKGVAVKKLNGS